jgi:hypothetical protein
MPAPARLHAPLPRPLIAQPSRAHAPEPAAALRGFLLAIVGREPASSKIELRPLHADGQPARERAFLPVGDLGEVERRVRELAPRTNVYVSAAPRVRPDGTAAAVERVWMLWADIDAEEGLRRLREFRPLPSIVLRTGTPGHGLALWPLREPLSPAHAQRGNRRLALALAADMNATDGARILRPPASMSHKHTPPRSVVCTRLEPARFAAAEVVGTLSDSRHYTRGPRRLRLPPGRGAPRAERVLLGLCRTVAQARPGGRNAALHWSACRAVEYSDAGELDLAHALDALASAALEVGLGAVEIRATLGSAQRTARAA